MGTQNSYDVYQQAADTSIWNTNAAVAKGAVVGVIGGIGAILVIGGWTTNNDVKVLQEQAGIIVPAVFVAMGVLQGIWTRASVWSGRTAARIALVNAKGTIPTLDV